MTQPLTLLLGVHAHQPVGNFPEVIADAHERCYRPFLHTLHGYPEFRFSAHFSGWLLDWLRERYPEDMALLAAMVRRGQVELFGSGDTEPVLAAIPQRDRVGQLQTLNGKLATWTGQTPQGAWLTERVWEASVVPALVEAGIGYVTVDDYHFFCTGRQARELDSFFSTEEGGVRLDLFPISEELRYRFPFSPAPDAVAYLERLADEGRAAAIYFDDIEKFGIWPETFDWVYTRGWLKAFIEGVLASPKIATATYADFHARHATRGVVYLPTTSYSEMNEWTLPMPAAGIYADLLAREKESGQLERHRPFLRGGIWRNFLSRYPEANWAHKRMLGLSERLRRLSRACAHPAPPSHKERGGIGHPSPSGRWLGEEGREIAELTAQLYRAQANDAYWHGLFGGLYLPHLRRALWNNLVALEAELDRRQPRPLLAQDDVDLDGHRENFCHDTLLQVVVRDDGLAAAIEVLSYPLAHNFGDTLCRYHEHYHDRISRAPSQQPGEGIASAHDIVRFKHPVTPEDIVPDALPRASWLDHVDGAPLSDYRMTKGEELAYERPGISKRYNLEQGRLTVTWRCIGLAGRRFATVLNLAMPSCDGFLGRYVREDGNIPCGFGQPLELAEARRLRLEDGVLGGALELACDRPAGIRGRPHITVSQSEAGFEKIMQAVELTFAWNITDDDCTLAFLFSAQSQPRS